MTSKPKYPRWIVLYYIHTPGSEWLGKGAEFFEDETSAQQRGHEMGAVQGYAAPMSLTDYLQETRS